MQMTVAQWSDMLEKALVIKGNSGDAGERKSRFPAVCIKSFFAEWTQAISFDAKHVSQNKKRLFPRDARCFDGFDFFNK